MVTCMPMSTLGPGSLCNVIQSKPVILSLPRRSKESLALGKRFAVRRWECIDIDIDIDTDSDIDFESRRNLDGALIAEDFHLLVWG